MKTDTLFYELFQAAPQTFFELLQITPTCPYRFESITVKASEKRIDGVFAPVVDDQPIYFLEVQAFPDSVIYFRTLREVATYFEQRPKLKDNEWYAAVLWLNKSDDPGFGTLQLLACKPNPRFAALDLVELLQKLPESSLALNVLRPLLVKSEREVRENVVQWVKNIRQASTLDATIEERLIIVMSQLIEQKFRTFSYKELSYMLQLTPLRETASVQEVLKEERIEALYDQIQEKLMLSDEIMAVVHDELMKLDMESLKALRRQILHLATLEQLENWIAEYLASHA